MHELHEFSRMKFLSICSGIEAASVAWEPLGWRATAFSEIEPFPCAVLARRWPGVPNLGDMTRHHEWTIPGRQDVHAGRSLADAAITGSEQRRRGGGVAGDGAEGSNGEERNGNAIDIVVGGTPCQAFSVAGLRKGLADPRGNLTLVFLGIIQRMRPRWVVWENVPGVLSESTGAFGAFLGGLEELGYGWAYRTLDAQYVRVDGYARAVPQRRRRVFVVGHLGGRWQRAAAVLFERESLCGNPAPRREAGKGIAASLAARAKGGGGLGTDFDCDGGTIPVGIDGGEVGFALRAEGSRSGDKGDGGMNQTRVIAFPARMSGTRRAAEREVGCAIAAKNETAVAHKVRARGPELPEVACALQERDSKGSDSSTKNGHLIPVSSAHSGRICPAVAGTLDKGIPGRGRAAEECPDGPRYKALGNSMAVNVMRWIGRRIQDVEGIPQ